MIDIFRGTYDSELNIFHGREFVRRADVIVKEREIYGRIYRYVEPAKPGNYAFGGTLLFTSNGIYPEFTTPLKLHDRNMDLERNSPND